MTDELLEQVLADPADDALRAVWADALQERGDPRGEAIALQLAAAGGPLDRAQDKRARSLLAKHAKSWLGPLEGVIMHKAALVFDRGLVSSCQIQIKRLAALQGAIGHPLWAALRSIWFCDSYAWDARIVPLLVHPAMASLREVTCIGANNVFPPLAKYKIPLPFTSLWLFDDGWRADTFLRDDARAGSAPALKALRHFGIHSSSDEIDWIFDLPVARRVESLGLASHLPPGAALARADALPKLRTFELRPGWIMNQGAYRPVFRLLFTRDATGRLSRLRIGRGHFVGPFAPRLDLPLTPDPKIPATLARLADELRFHEDLFVSVAGSVREVEVDLPDVRGVRSALRPLAKATIHFAK